jgi:hypothetical protein
MEHRWLVAAACCCILGQMAASVHDEADGYALDDSDDDGQVNQSLGESQEDATGNMDEDSEPKNTPILDDTLVHNMQALFPESRTDEHNVPTATTKVSAHELDHGQDNTKCMDLASPGSMHECCNASPLDPLQRNAIGPTKDDLVRDSQQQAGASNTQPNRRGGQRGVMEWYMEFARRLLHLLGVVEHK